jgi:hypothetical protein
MSVAIMQDGPPVARDLYDHVRRMLDARNDTITAMVREIAELEVALTEANDRLAAYETAKRVQTCGS